MFLKKLKKKLAFINTQGKISLLILFCFVPFYLCRLYFLPKVILPEERPVKIRGMVVQQPYLKGSHQIIRLNSVLIMTERFPGYFYGDRLEIIGSFKKQLLGSFNYYYLSVFPSIKKVEREDSLINKTVFKKLLFKTKGQIKKGISSLLPEPHASLLLGIILGMRSEVEILRTKPNLGYSGMGYLSMKSKYPIVRQNLRDNGLST